MPPDRGRRSSPVGGIPGKHHVPGLGDVLSWLVTGGGGYIGAHVVRSFQEVGLDAVVVDDLSSGHREFVRPEVPFVEGSIVDTETYTLGDRNTQGFVANALLQQPDVIAMAGLTADDAAQLHQIRAANSKVAGIDTEAGNFRQSFGSM